MASIRSVYKSARISPAKVRPLAKLIRGKKVSQALNILMFNNSKAATYLDKTLKSALANLENNLGENPENFVLSKISVDKAGVLKRMKPRARGRADRIIKRSSHITIELSG